MNSTPDTPLSPPPPPPPDPGPPPPPDGPAPGPKRFERSSTDRLIGGVCGGLGRYFGIDPTLVRIGMVALALLGGAGLVVYAAALVLVPSDGEVAAGPTDTRDRAIAVVVAVVLTIVGLSLGLFGLAIGGAVFPLAFLCVAGLAVWWLVSGERPSGSPGEIARRAALGIALLFGCFALSVGSFFASGFGGGVVIAALVIAAGAALVAAAFVGGARWLVLPALAIALPLAFVSAAGIDLDGGFGDRHVRPGTVAEVKDSYRLGAGELTIDLRDVDLPAGDRRVKVGMGTGHVLVLVPDDVCVASSATVGMGGVSVFERDGGGIDVDWDDARRAPAGTARLVIDGEVGLGLLEVRHDESDAGDHGPFGEGRGFDGDSVERNSACATRTASSGASNG
jgi:phage shock protein PspC (stress-responsive transcriptional regulator)